MSQSTQLPVVDLGPAKEVTKGVLIPPMAEDHPTRPYQQIF